MPRQSRRGRFANYFSRSAVKVRNNLGIIAGDDREGVRKTRNKLLDIYDAYAESTQYDKLPEWDTPNDRAGEFIPVRKRQPRIIFNFAKVLTDRMAGKLVGHDLFPDLRIEDDEDDDAFIKAVLKLSKLRQRIMPAAKLMCLSGSSLLRFQLVEGVPQLETFHSKYCYPEFDGLGQLTFVKIMYVFEDDADKDQNGNPKKKWYRLDLGEQTDILYDTPEYQMEANPVFKPVNTEAHGLGFVQAHWFRTDISKHSPDGPSLIGDILDFIDELNYNLSQSSQAVAYNQEPQLAISGLMDEEITGIVRTSAKAIALGKEGKAAFIESNLLGVQVAGELRDKVRLHIQDVARILLLDPEKIVGHAQSGEAMKVLHGPMIELINELRPMLLEGIVELVQKIAMALLTYNARGFEVGLEIPVGYMPKGLDIVETWPEIFPMTMEDLAKKVGIATQLASAEIYSREWAAEYLASDVGIEDLEEELAKVAAQAPLMPFGATFPTPGGSGE
jgi:hypothetical protein